MLREINTVIGGDRVEDFFEVLKRIVDAVDEDEKEIIFDFSGVDFIDTRGIGAIVETFSRSGKYRKRVRAENISEIFKETLMRFNLGQLEGLNLA